MEKVQHPLYNPDSKHYYGAEKSAIEKFEERFLSIGS
jgi:ribosomal protein L31